MFVPWTCTNNTTHRLTSRQGTSHVRASSDETVDEPAPSRGFVRGGGQQVIY
jgi:hypothetical protein